MSEHIATELEQKQWDQFVLASPHASFLQSWAWGEMQRELAVSYWRLSVERRGGMAAATLVYERSLPAGYGWLYIPRGPVLAADSKTLAGWSDLKEQLFELAVRQRSVFMRLEPSVHWPNAEDLGEGWRKASHDIQPCHTLIVDLTKSEDDLLQAMHSKTRYNIRLAQRRGVRVRFSTDERDLEAFLQLSRDVGDRSTFRYHPDNYYRVMHQVLAEAGMFNVALAEFNGQVLAAHILITFGDTVTYAHGASSSRQRDVMGPHLLQWESMRWAKLQTKKYYDFFGVAPAGVADSHPWSGITRFKVGFGGRRVSYMGAYDLVLHEMLYALYNISRRARSLVR